MNDTVSNAINQLKVVLAIFVVFIHSQIRINPQNPDIDFFHALTDIWGSIISLAVPTFYIISGFLFFRNGANISRCEYKLKYKRRIKSLIIPYLLWNTIGLACLLLKKTPLLAPYFPLYQDFHITLWNILKGYLSIGITPLPYAFSLWFIRNLILVSLFAPLIARLIKLFGAYALLSIVPIIVIDDTIFADVNVYNLQYTFVFFISGAVLATHFRNLLNTKHTIAYFVCFIALALTDYYVGATPVLHAFAYTAKSMTGALLLIKLSLTITTKGRRFPIVLSDSTFFVFAFHALFSTSLGVLICSRFPPISNAVCLFDVGFRFAILYSTSIVAFTLMRKYCPKLTRILCGGRISGASKDNEYMTLA